MIYLCTMTSVCPDMTLDETIAAMKKYGYTGLEPRVEWKHAQGIELTMDASQRAELKARFVEEGLSMPCLATSIRMAEEDKAKRQADIDLLQKYIDMAADLGIPNIRTFGGGFSGEMRGVVNYMAAGYKQVMQHAADRGVTVLLETHDAWCNSAQVAAVIRKVNHPNMAVLWDIMHPQRFSELVSHTFDNIGRMTRHLHAHDGYYEEDGRKLVVGKLGKGEIDHATPLKMLSEIGFNGAFSVEVIHKVGSDHDAEGVMAQYAEEFNRIMRNL